MAALNYHLFALLVSVCLFSLQTEAGTWLSFNPKTGGLEAEPRMVAMPVAPQVRSASEGDLLRLLKGCNDNLSKRSFIEHSKRDAAMCRDLMDFVARRR
uniref:Neuropeptide-Like Protein n=1 Tax=Panagrellus redivivus TaxID=6233 RepID=A0A7E4ZZI8_PANRE